MLPQSLSEQANWGRFRTGAGCGRPDQGCSELGFGGKCLQAAKLHRSAAPPLPRGSRSCLLGTLPAPAALSAVPTGQRDRLVALSGDPVSGSAS